MMRRMLIVAIGVFLPLRALAADAAPPKVDDLISKASVEVTRLVDEFSNVQCIEHVEQNKLRPDGKLELKQESTYDYLVILTNTDGELALQESRIAVKDAKTDRKNRPMLLSNGFATLFLVFHPMYNASFHFSDAGLDTLNGRVQSKVTFEHIPGMRSPAALALRGREYPLELSGAAWIDAETGALVRIEAGIGDTLLDVGLKSFRALIDFAPFTFPDARQPYWLPVSASVEVETPRQRWRNTHRFTDYKEFSVGTEEKDKKVAAK